MTSIFKILTLNVLFIFLAVSAQAQKNNAHVQYVLNFEGNEQAAMFNGSLLDIYFAPDNSKLVLNMMSGMIKMDMRMNVKGEKGIMLMDMMGQQKYKTIDAEDINKDDDKADKSKMPDIKYLKEYKEIAGYKCQKALLSMEGQAEKMVIYFTDKIEMPKGFEKYTEQLNMAGMKGFPMAMEINTPEMKMNIIAKAVDLSKQAKKIFEIKAPEGYTEMTDEDLQGMGGMGGF
ncbi:MAG: hypothetical protein ACRBFS_01605 [Aureispira sp.]